MYAALGSRPDLAFAIQHLSQFTTTHGNEHWTAVKHVLRYLRGTRDAGIVFKKTDKLELETCGFGLCEQGGRSLYWEIHGNVRRWLRSLELKEATRTMALSATEAEYITITEGAKEMVWL